MALTDTQTLGARNAVAIVFALNGLAMSSWMSRIPEARSALDLSPGQLGTLLLAISIGALIAMPTAGFLVTRYGATAIVTGAAVIDAIGLVVAGFGAGAAEQVGITAIGLFLFGFGSGVWDIAMNVEGAAVEHELGRTIMPRFHAAFSLGTVIGAAIGAGLSALEVPIALHLAIAAVLVAGVPAYAARTFLPAGGHEEETDDGAKISTLRAWAEPRTLVIGLMVLALALTEGTANDWLAVALVDGHDVEHWVGSAGFAVFVTAMTAGRMYGSILLDRFGRTQVLWATMAVAEIGVLMVVLTDAKVIVVAGIILWGLGSSLGFPVGMSAAADDPRMAAVRVSVVSTIAYTAFLAGPPLLGYVGDKVGTLDALLVVALLLIPSALSVPAARSRR